MPLSTSVIVSEVCKSGSMQAFLHGGEVSNHFREPLREVSNHFREPLERSLLDFKDLIISKRSKGIIQTIF